MSGRSELFDGIRVLAALEVELDRLLAEQVIKAQKCGLPWENVAEAAGIAKPTAWRRWKPLLEADRPSRAQRRSGPDLTLNQDQVAVAGDLVEELLRRVTSPPEPRPWATAVRAALDKLRLQYDWNAVDARETEFRVKAHRLHITCGEPRGDWAGAARAVVRAPLEPGERSADQEVTVTGTFDSEAGRTQAVTDLIRKLVG